MQTCLVEQLYPNQKPRTKKTAKSKAKATCHNREKSLVSPEYVANYVIDKSPQQSPEKEIQAYNDEFAQVVMNLASKNKHEFVASPFKYHRNQDLPRV